MTTLVETLRLAVQSSLADMHTVLPGQIVSYDYTKQCANVLPLLKKEYKDGRVDAMPVIVNVPVIWPRAGGASLTFPVREGDGVLLVFSERALENWLSEGGEQTPGDPRKFDLSDAIAIPGLNPFTLPSLATNNTDVLLTYRNASIRIAEDGTTTVTNGAASYVLQENGDVNVSAQNVTYNCARLRVTGELEVGEDIVDRWNYPDANSARGFRTIYNAHTHNETDSVTGSPNQQM